MDAAATAGLTAADDAKGGVGVVVGGIGYEGGGGDPGDDVGGGDRVSDRAGDRAGVGNGNGGGGGGGGGESGGGGGRSRGGESGGTDSISGGSRCGGWVRTDGNDPSRASVWWKPPSLVERGKVGLHPPTVSLFGRPQMEARRVADDWNGGQI